MSDPSMRTAVVGSVVGWVLTVAALGAGLLSAIGLGPCPVPPSISSIAILALVMLPAVLGTSVLTRRATAAAAPAWPAQICGGAGVVICALAGILAAWLPAELPAMALPLSGGLRSGFLPLALVASAAVAAFGFVIERRSANAA